MVDKKFSKMKQPFVIHMCLFATCLFLFASQCVLCKSLADTDDDSIIIEIGDPIDSDDPWQNLADEPPSHNHDHIDDDFVIDLSSLGDRIYGIPKSINQRSLSKANAIANPEEMGPYAEGDILIPANALNGRNGMTHESYRWTDGRIPFEIIGTFEHDEVELIEKAMTIYHEKTCIKFVPRQRNDPDYITIQNSETGCWSAVGRVGGRQLVNLQSYGCTSLIGTILHEFMHVVGFLHEQNREERDEYVDIRFENVRKGYEMNFDRAEKGTTSGFGVGYDYKSVMHYSAMAFSANGQPTIVTKVIFMSFIHLFL